MIMNHNPRGTGTRCSLEDNLSRSSLARYVARSSVHHVARSCAARTARPCGVRFDEVLVSHGRLSVNEVASIEPKSLTARSVGPVVHARLGGQPGRPTSSLIVEAVDQGGAEPSVTRS